MCGAGHGYAFPILFGFTVTRSPVAVRGATLSFFTALFDIGVLIGGPLLGAIISVSGYPAMYGVAAALISIASVIYWRWDRRYDREDSDEDVPAPTP
jgi:predicted MFS family arabinose efflux permease